MNWKSFKTVLKSRFKKQTEEDWIEQRREICRVCPLNTKNSKSTTLKVKIYKHLSDFYTWLTRAKNNKDDGSLCSICGCNLFYLCGEPESRCSDTPPKWESI